MVNATEPVLLVDVDGVLILGRNADRSHWATDLRRAFGFDKAALREHFFQPYWADIVTGKDELMPRLIQALQAMGSTANAADLRDYWFANDALLNEKLLTWLDRKRNDGYRIMLATNQEHERANYLVEALGLGAYCDGIHYSAALGVAKPNALFFQEISKREDRPPRDLIFIDDTPANVDAARRAGLRAVHYTGQSVDQLTTAIVSGES